MEHQEDSASQPGSQNEELVAYLDGELSAEERRRVEERLAHDDSARQEIQRLQSAWEMLDLLPGTEVAPSFSGTTLEMVALVAEEDSTRQREAVARSRWARRLWATFGWCAAACGIAWMTWSIPADKNETLLKDYPLVQDLDAYLEADSAEFVRMLHQEGLFTEDSSDDY
jgi:anti-sigma factor RsiW